VFGEGYDLAIYDDSNRNSHNMSALGYSYENDTRVKGDFVLAGSGEFMVREIEVFQIEGLPLLDALPPTRQGPPRPTGQGPTGHQPSLLSQPLRIDLATPPVQSPVPAPEMHPPHSTEATDARNDDEIFEEEEEEEAPQPPEPRLRSEIVHELPLPAFQRFSDKEFRLLWRGTRDGFKVTRFHELCDGHGNTITLIRDTKNNIFGGFTSVSWDRTSGWKGDERADSFIFSLSRQGSGSNPNSIQIFQLKAGAKDRSIFCDVTRGPVFGGGYDLGIYDDSDANDHSMSAIGDSYECDEGVDGSVILCGSETFRVSEIEVFEIRDSEDGQ
jgi:hypothetical protein